MQHNLTKNQILILLTNDSTFRQSAAERLVNMTIVSPLDQIKARVRCEFPEWQTTQKIAAIKWIREYAGKFDSEARVLMDAGYEFHERSGTFPLTGSIMVMGLAAAKRFVESC